MWWPSRQTRRLLQMIEMRWDEIDWHCEWNITKCVSAFTIWMWFIKNAAGADIYRYTTTTRWLLESDCDEIRSIDCIMWNITDFRSIPFQIEYVTNCVCPMFRDPFETRKALPAPFRAQQNKIYLLWKYLPLFIEFVSRVFQISFRAFLIVCLSITIMFKMHFYLGKLSILNFEEF